MAVEKRKMICIRCPRGCEIETTFDGWTVMEVRGNSCRLGEDYARTEVSDPRRVVTTTVRVRNGVLPVIPVWTSSAVRKDMIFEVMRSCNLVEIEAPVLMDQVIVKDVCGTGADIRASRNLAARGKGS